MRAAADQRAAAAVEMHGLARLFGDSDVCRGLRRLLDIELAAAARRKQLAHQAGQGGEAGQGAEAGQVRPTRAQRRRAQRKRCAQRMRNGCDFDSGSSGGTGCGLQEQGAEGGPLEAKLHQPKAAPLAEQQRGALVEIECNSIAAGDAAAGDAAGNQAEMTATADSAATAAPDKQPEPEEQAAASAAALQPMESQAEMQAEHVGREGQGEQQGQRVQPRRAAAAEPHKRRAVVANTGAAGDHAGTVIDVSGPEEASAAAAPTSGWQMVVRGRARAAQRQAAAVAAGGRKSRAAKPAAGRPPGMSGPMASIMDAIRCGRAFDCLQCGELGIWQGASCESCTGMVEG